MMDPTTIENYLPTLSTRRLVLRKLRGDDAEGYFAFSGDSQVTQYLRWGPHASLHESENYLASILAAYENRLDGPWGIELASEYILVGIIHLMNVDVVHRKAEIGVVIGRKYWGVGLGTEALSRVLSYCFINLGLNRVEGFSVVENIAAQRMMEKCGMRREGIFREAYWQKGKFWDFELHAILAREFTR